MLRPKTQRGGDKRRVYVAASSHTVINHAELMFHTITTEINGGCKPSARVIC